MDKHRLVVRLRRRAWVLSLVWAAAAGCAGRRPNAGPLTVANPTLGTLTIAVAPAMNLSGSTGFDPDRFADLMAGELMHAERVSVVGVSRVLAVLSSQGTDRVQSPKHASEIAALVGADAILVFAVTEYDPYDPPRAAISAQLFGASGRPVYGAPIDEPEAGESKGGQGSTPVRRVLAETQGRFDASHADIVADVREYASRRTADDSPLGWKKYVVSQQHFIQYCCHATIRDLLSGRRLAASGLGKDRG